MLPGRPSADARSAVHGPRSLPRSSMIYVRAGPDTMAVVCRPKPEPCSRYPSGMTVQREGFSVAETPRKHDPIGRVLMTCAPLEQLGPGRGCLTVSVLLRSLTLPLPRSRPRLRAARSSPQFVAETSVPPLIWASARMCRRAVRPPSPIRALRTERYSDCFTMAPDWVSHRGHPWAIGSSGHLPCTLARHPQARQPRHHLCSRPPHHRPSATAHPTGSRRTTHMAAASPTTSSRSAADRQPPRPQRETAPPPTGSRPTPDR